jgi:hypothetical protein
MLVRLWCELHPNTPMQLQLAFQSVDKKNPSGAVSDGGEHGRGGNQVSDPVTLTNGPMVADQTADELGFKVSSGKAMAQLQTADPQWHGYESAVEGQRRLGFQMPDWQRQCVKPRAAGRAVFAWIVDYHQVGGSLKVSTPPILRCEDIAGRIDRHALNQPCAAVPSAPICPFYTA